MRKIKLIALTVFAFAFVQISGWSADPFDGGFEKTSQIPKSWKSEGKVTIDSKEAFKGRNSICFERTEKEIDNPTSLLMESFPAKEGIWEFGVAYKSDVYSPDDSYNGMVYLESLDAGGKVIESSEFALIKGKNGWKEFKKKIDLPNGTASARFKIIVSKTYGKFNVDEFSSAYVSPSPRVNCIFKAIKMAPKVLGGMFLPEDKIVFDITAECTKDWATDNRQLTFIIRDYCGAEIIEPVKVKFESAGGTRYKGVLDLSAQKFEVGKFHEVYVEALFGNSEPLKERSSFVILPKAVTKNYKPSEIPFTSRNWDNRLPDYFRLSDRIGVRWCGIWSGWDAKPPYNPVAPSIEFCKELDMGAVLGTPCSAIEGRRGNYKDYNETAMREGAKNLVNKYKDYVPLMISLGNEPNGQPDRVKDDIAAYKPVYEEVKKIDPNIIVIGTSCGLDEEFFKQGFQPYQDVYDFHLYESPNNIRQAFKKYEAFFKKYGHKKPIWSTEIGLNSAGQTRLAITRDMIKKFAIFFACGGQNMSWFDILYPDGEGKNDGTTGESMNVFKCKYSLYCPRLDAVSYYNMVNGICIKKFVQEKIYDRGGDAVLFRDKDSKCLVVLWKEEDSMDAFFPMKGVGKVKLIRIDGSSVELDAQGKGLHLTISEDPILLFFDSADMKLAEKLENPSLKLNDTFDPVVKGSSQKISFTAEGVRPDDISFVAPPFWTVGKAEVSGKEISFNVTAPAVTGTRKAKMLVSFKNKDGELAFYLPVSEK
ncbi:MAG TPA: hypothetical protein DET40_22470 [Lentisphaeria bacterium]|nr:MAG: hypothetical protein A2X45_17200 [Lentisphaerae bacterium GWF2_50_93]HCE46320.1 hypothetical protein [Lentisphaeria bacterium]